MVMTYASIMIGLKVAVIQGNKKKDIKDTTTKKYYELIVYKPKLHCGPLYPGTQLKQRPVLISHLLSWQFFGQG